MLQRGRRSMAAVTIAGSDKPDDWAATLQRGRRSMAAVTHVAQVCRGPRQRASTGPPLDGGGDIVMPWPMPPRTRSKLQRGRRSMAAVTKVMAFGILNGNALQRGRRSMAAVTEWVRLSHHYFSKTLQRGRRSMAAVTTSRARTCTSASRCFNGAAARWRR